MAGSLLRAERPVAMGTGAKVDCVCVERGRGGAVAVALGRCLATRAHSRETACSGLGFFPREPWVLNKESGASGFRGEADRAGGEVRG